MLLLKLRRLSLALLLVLHIYIRMCAAACPRSGRQRRRCKLLSSRILLLLRRQNMTRRIPLHGRILVTVHDSAFPVLIVIELLRLHRWWLTRGRGGRGRGRTRVLKMRRDVCLRLKLRRQVCRWLHRRLLEESIRARSMLALPVPFWQRRPLRLNLLRRIMLPAWKVLRLRMERSLGLRGCSRVRRQLSLIRKDAVLRLPADRLLLLLRRRRLLRLLLLLR